MWHNLNTAGINIKHQEFYLNNFQTVLIIFGKSSDTDLWCGFVNVWWPNWTSASSFFQLGVLNTSLPTELEQSCIHCYLDRFATYIFVTKYFCTCCNYSYCPLSWKQTTLECTLDIYLILETLQLSVTLVEDQSKKQYTELFVFICVNYMGKRLNYVVLKHSINYWIALNYWLQISYISTAHY